MPAYVNVTFVVVGLGLVLALTVPAPRMPLPVAAQSCRALAIAGFAALATAIALPAFDVWYPALAVVGGGLIAWFTMFWIANRPDLIPMPAIGEGLQDDQDDEEGGGGGGGSRTPDRGPEPPAPEGLDWDAFDRQRRVWERDRETTLLSV